MIELRTRVAGEMLTLHADRALWWARQRTLMVADVHFGKGSVLRRAGVAVPTGQTAADLTRLDALITHYQPRQLIVLGDLVHGKAPQDAPWISAVIDWRQRHRAIEMTLVAGNHDRHFDARTLGFEVVEHDLLVAPFALRHMPGRIDNAYVLAGHVHAGVAVRDGWRKHRLPAFRFHEHGGILPAFGALTGLHDAPPEPGERVFAVTPAGMLALHDERH